MSSTRTRAAASVAALALALVPAACGSDTGASKPLSSKEYNRQAQKISKQFFIDVQATQAKIVSASDQKGRVAGLRGFKQAFTTFADRFEKLSPPKKLASEQKRLVSKVRESAGDIDGVVAAVKAKSRARARAAQKALQEDVAAVKASAQKLDAGSG